MVAEIINFQQAKEDLQNKRNNEFINEFLDEIADEFTEQELEGAYVLVPDDPSDMDDYVLFFMDNNE